MGAVKKTQIIDIHHSYGNVEKLIHCIQPDELQVISIDPPFRKVLGVDEETLAKGQARMRRCMGKQVKSCCAKPKRLFQLFKL